MKVWGKKVQPVPAGSGVARAALEGASREELLQEVLHALAVVEGADRLGVWIAGPQMEGDDGLTSFRGLVLDRGGESTPAEWTRLSPEAALPLGLLRGGKSVSQDLLGSPETPLIGPLVEMRCALWVPVSRNGGLRGVLLAATRGKKEALPLTPVESVAAQLELALELEEQQRLAREHHGDHGLTRRVLAAISGGLSPDATLANLADNCTETAAHGLGTGAAFTVIGVLTLPPAENREGEEIQFHWKSGKDSWTRAVECEPLADVWRRSLQERRVIGCDAHMPGAKGEVGRIVAIPLETEEVLTGVLVAGLRPGTASLALLERFELRGALAAAALAQRRRREEEARKTAWHHALLEASNEATVLLDPHGQISAISRAAWELLSGHGPQEKHSAASTGSGEYFAQFFCGRDQEKINAWSRRILGSARHASSASGHSLEAELRNGLRVRVKSAVPVAGAPAAVFLQPLASHTAAHPSSAAEAELRGVLEWLEEGVVLFDASNNVRVMNARFAQMAGLSPQDSATLTTFDGLLARMAEQAADSASFAEHWRQLSRGNAGGVREEIQLVRPSPRVLERASRPVLDATGGRLGWVEIYRDLTARRIFQSKLLQTEKLAALGQMITGVAHELSNPLTSILGYAQRLLLRNDIGGGAEEAGKILQEADRAGAILRQLLRVARESPPERRAVALNQVVLRTMELQRFSVAAEKISVELDLDPALPLVLGDAGQLQQVLMNILGNARQAIEQQGRGGTIRVRTRCADQRGVILEVSDDGPGIPQAIMARIFDPFFTTKAAGVGTGLGLAIVLGIVREHGGHVNVSSPPGGGAVFSIELPASSVQALETERRPPLAVDSRAFPWAAPDCGPGDHRAPLAPPASLTDWRGARVLVIEDEPTVARLIADVLEDEGLQVDVLLDGREALARAVRETYALAICDMKMPGLSGQYFYETLVHTGNPLRDHFLFVTGDTLAPQTHEFLERNHVPHLAKPFRVEELTESVGHVLNRHAGGRAAVVPAVRKNTMRNG